MLPMCKEVKCWSFSTLSIVSQRCVREKKNFVAAIFMVNFLPRCARNIKATNFRHMNMMSNSPIKGVFFFIKCRHLAIAETTISIPRLFGFCFFIRKHSFIEYFSTYFIVDMRSNAF